MRQSLLGTFSLKRASKIKMHPQPWPFRPEPQKKWCWDWSISHCLAWCTIPYVVFNILLQVRPPHVAMCHDLHACHTRVIFVYIYCSSLGLELIDLMGSSHGCPKVSVAPFWIAASNGSRMTGNPHGRWWVILLVPSNAPRSKQGPDKSPSTPELQ